LGWFDIWGYRKSYGITLGKLQGQDFVQKIFFLLTGLLIILGGKSILADGQNKDIQKGKIRKNKKKSFVV
jgi:hypothetical protein